MGNHPYDYGNKNHVDIEKITLKWAAFIYYVFPRQPRKNVC